MTITSELEKLQTNLENSYTSAANKGATLPEDQNFDNLSATIDTITGGGSDENVYGVDLGAEHISTLLNNDVVYSNKTVYNVLNGTITGENENLSGSWTYKPQSYKEYLQNILTGDNEKASNILIDVRDGSPDPARKIVNPATLLANKKYFAVLEGGGGGSSTWKGGAGGYWVGTITPSENIDVEISQGLGGFGASRYSRRHSGKAGGASSIVGNGLSIICPGGQGAIGLRVGDEDGTSSTYTYAPEILVTKATIETIEDNVTMRPRQKSWLTNSSGDTGAGGLEASGTKQPGHNGFDGVAYVSQCYTVQITPNVTGCSFTGEFEVKFGGFKKTMTITNNTGTFYVPSNLDVTKFDYTVSKTGYITQTGTEYITEDTTISVTMYIQTTLIVNVNVIPDMIEVFDYDTYEPMTPEISEDELTYTYKWDDAEDHNVDITIQKVGYNTYTNTLEVTGSQNEPQQLDVELEQT